MVTNYQHSHNHFIMNAIAVKIECSEHGVFEQTPSVHLKGRGCQKCAGTQLATKMEFLCKAARVHEDRYDYTKVRQECT